MKKKEFIDLVIVQLSGGTPALKQKQKFHPVVVEKQIALVFNSLISEIKDHDLIQQYCVRVSEIPVSTNQRGKKYSVIPKTFLTTKYTLGIWVYAGGSDTPMSYRKNNTSAVYNNLEVSQIWTKAAYSIEGQNIIYQVLPDHVKDVDFVLLVPFDELDDNDNIIMPDGKDSEAFTAILSQMQELKGTPMQYKTDNNTTTQ